MSSVNESGLASYRRSRAPLGYVYGFKRYFSNTIFLTWWNTPVLSDLACSRYR